MQLTSFYPVIGTDKVSDTRDFYLNYLDFEVTFESDWYVSLKRVVGHPYELAILDFKHPTMPDAYQKPVQGLLLNFEVDNVDVEYVRLITQGGLPIIRDLKTEDFGQRHFVTVDPNGILLDIITVVPATGDFASQYTQQSQSPAVTS